MLWFFLIASKIKGGKKFEEILVVKSTNEDKSAKYKIMKRFFQASCHEDIASTSRNQN